ncbi:electron carrier/ protein disulfide oxidoreductase [Anaeramoeba flamelloides]|uniref:Electron carrier/ protein disulfide oxidoreductase n=1 Tax=Anaeramoeba flamelloides TaxID=1746091 RepID=A0ABQ8XCV5_9EUKA|nr:electron carrier/ protein disulfide oxidoreductase [Anaeramoeba flamelloides]
MWKRKNKNKHLNKKTNKQIEKEQSERTERLVQSLEAKIQQLEFQLSTLKNEEINLQNGILSSKIKEIEERNTPHEKEKKELQKDLERVKKKVIKEEIKKKKIFKKKKKLIKLKNNKISSLEKKIQNFKTNPEVEGVLILLERKNKKLTQQIKKTNHIKKERTELKKECAKLKMEEETGSWKRNLTETELLKLEQQDHLVSQLENNLENHEKRLKKIQFQKRINSDNSPLDYVRIKQKLKENNKKISVATKENQMLKGEILETKELLGDETNQNTTTNSFECQTEDSLTDSEFNQNHSSSSKNIMSSSLTQQNLNQGSKKKQSETKSKIELGKKPLTVLTTSNPTLLINEPTLDYFTESTKVGHKQSLPIRAKSDLVKQEKSQKRVHLEKKLQNSYSNPQIVFHNSLPDLSFSNHNTVSNFKNGSFDRPSLKPKKTEFKIDSLQKLLSIPIGVDYFKEYLDSCLCQENIMFWMEVKSMKQYSQTQKHINKLSKKIFKKYIIEESPFEINIISSIREKLIKQYENKIFYSKMFDEAHKAVYGHMFLNSWTEFRETDQFKKLNKKVKKDPKFASLQSLKKMKFRYNIQPYKALNEGFEYNNKISQPLVTAEHLLLNLIQLLNLHYKISENQINLKKVNSNIAFQKFTHLTAQLKHINLSLLKSEKEKLCFFINVYNLLSLHSLVTNGAIPHNKSSWNHHFKNSIYVIDGSYFSLYDIFHGILRANTSPKYNLNKYFKTNDERAKHSLLYIEPMVHFATVDQYKPTILKIYKPKTVMADLKETTHDFLHSLTDMKTCKQIILPKSCHIYEKDFLICGDIINWLSSFFDNLLISKTLANENIKFSTKISKKQRLIINCSSFSIYKYHFLK